MNPSSISTRRVTALAEVAAFETLIDQYYSAWSVAFASEGWELCRPAVFYAQDENLIFFDPLRPVEGYHGWKTFHTAVVEAVQQWGIAIADIHRTSEVLIWQVGDVVWAIVPHRVTAKLRHGQFEQSDQRHTFVWQQQNGQWKIIHEHASGVIPLRTHLAHRHRHLPTSSHTAEFESLLRLFWAAWNTKQADIVGEFYAPAADVSVYLPWQLEEWIGWQAVQLEVDRWFRTMREVEFTPYSDVYVLRFDQLAIAIGIVSLQLHQRDGTLTRGDARYTLIWKKQQEQWKVLHQHFSSTLN